MPREQKPIKFNQLKIENIIFTELEDNDRVSAQKIGYIRYKADKDDKNGYQLSIQAPKISYEVFGIPREGPYYPSAHKRAYFKFPFCHERRKHTNDINYDEIENLYNLLLSIDKHVGSDEFRKKLFGEKLANKYAYSKLVRSKDEDEDDEPPRLDKNGNPYYSPPYKKIKLDLAYNKQDTPPENISTKPMFSIYERIDGVRKQVELNNFDDVLKYITYGSKLRFIISFSKLYAMKNSSGSDKKMYGITLKATHIEVEDHIREMKQSTNDDPFDSDTEETINTSKITRNLASLDVENDDSDDEVRVKPSHDLKDDSDDEVRVKLNHNLKDDSDDEEEVIEDTKAKSKQTIKPKAKATIKTR